MRLLVNASNLGPGGATQVADSFCSSLDRFSDIQFVVVLTPQMKNIAEKIIGYENVKTVVYQIHNTWRSYLFARDKFLDNLVESENIDMVFSIFAPTWWTPRKPHLCGFALAHLIMPESPYFKTLHFKQRLKQALMNKILTFYYWRSSKYYYTENPMVTERVHKLLHCRRVYTITNYYNQIFDQPENQVYKKMTSFDGVTLLTITSAYPHKNLSIAIDIANNLKVKHPDFKFRFVFTIKETEYPSLPNEVKDNFLFIGRVDISECPSLYEQCDIAFQPTLLECFTATYPESMRMNKPIVTTDLEFARGLCGDAAIYYDPLSAEDASEKIYFLANNKNMQLLLASKGKEQLNHFDNYTARADKLVKCCIDVYDLYYR
ncbi:MAG: glycosyltransferase [Bacteroidales bacterium]|nr:glycosyltransferase [Bacteroidales bacterium]